MESSQAGEVSGASSLSPVVMEDSMKTTATTTAMLTPSTPSPLVMIRVSKPCLIKAVRSMSDSDFSPELKNIYIFLYICINICVSIFVL